MIGKPAPGLIIAAPASGSGKTTVALALMRALSRQNARVAPVKVGPDYIDPGFHTLACGRPSTNLDPWGMRADTRAALIADLCRESDIVIAEGAMGLFDGAADGWGSSADLAAEAGWPVLMVIDVKGQGASAAAVLRGFRDHRPDIRIAGVLFNRVGGDRHGKMLRDAVSRAGLGIPVLGCLPRMADLHLESRHLGLVQAAERADIDRFMDRAADWVDDHSDLTAILNHAARGTVFDMDPPAPPLPPLGQRIAVADDVAFAFAYPHVLDGWRRAGAEILPFSPLAGDGPPADADAVYLPGGYPELHAGAIAANEAFLSGLRSHAASGRPVFGECGGYMVLGRGIVDADGARHEMAGLLGVETSFQARKMHLGYRRIAVAGDAAPWKKGLRLRGHEFHYATTLTEDGSPLFKAQDALGTDCGPQGLVDGTVAGSFLHLIDRAD